MSTPEKLWVGEKRRRVTALPQAIKLRLHLTTLMESEAKQQFEKVAYCITADR